MSTVKHSPQAKNHRTNPNRTTSSKTFRRLWAMCSQTEPFSREGKRRMANSQS